VSPSRATTTPTTRRRSAARRTYVLDTSVLLADPGAIARFDEHEVVLRGAGASGAELLLFDLA